MHWSAAGDRLHYVRETDGALMVVDVSLGDPVRLSPPRVLFTESTSGAALSAGIAVSRDTGRYLVVRRTVPRGGQAPRFVLMDDWLRRPAGGDR